MAFDCNNNNNNNQRKPLLFSELFKSPGSTCAPEPLKLEGSSCSSSSTQFLSSYDSSSSGFSTPLYSDLESEDGDFIAELTRQMAECMLEEKEEEEEEEEEENDSISEVKNQPPVSKKGPFCRGKRVKGTESAQQKQIKKTELQYKQYAGKINGYSGSGMQAVFLGGSGPRIGPPGTGVFFPRDPSELKNKSGRSCSTVLIPTRVLQVLEELQLGKIQDSTSTTKLGGAASSTSPQVNSPISNEGWEVGSGPRENDELQLPQEWTY